MQRMQQTTNDLQIFVIKNSLAPKNRAREFVVEYGDTKVQFQIFCYIEYAINNRNL